MDGVVTGWSRIGIPGFAKLVDETAASYRLEHPQASLTLLSRLHRELQNAPESNWRNKKLQEVETLLRDCAGLFVEVSCGEPFLVPGDSAQTTFVINKRAGGNVQLRSAKIFNSLFMVNQVLPVNENVRYNLSVPVPANTPVSQPYWLRSPMQRGSFTVEDQSLIGKPWNDPVAAEVNVVINGAEFTLPVPLVYKNTDPVKGEIMDQIAVVPPFEVKALPSLGMSTNGDTVTTTVFTRVNTSHGNYDTIRTYVTPGISQNRDGNRFSYVSQNAQQGNVRYVLRRGDQQYAQYRTLIDYAHIPKIIYFRDAEMEFIPLQVKTVGKRVGYIPGAGDKIPEALQKIGYEVVILGEDMNIQSLEGLDAVVAGVRAYNVHDWLFEKKDMLMDYVQAGGVFLVQYNTNSNLGPLNGGLGPQTFHISRTRVTNEEAPVVFIDPSSDLLNYPNQISGSDFEGWVQERSLYHATDYSGYQTLLSMSDPGEAPNDGSLIYLNHGKGRFIYTGLSFFRQLPAGVPGAFRLFANLLAPPQP